MTDAKKLLVTRRRTEFFIFRRRFGFEQFCERCAAQSQFLSLEDAMLISDSTMREVVRRADTGEIHFLESKGGLLVICQTSLKPKAEKTFAEIERTEKHNLLKGEAK